VRFVDGAGQIVSNGGRVMKNVTGYDLVKLMAGSRGTLGVLTEVSLKVMPKAPARATLRLSGLDDAQSLAAMTRAMRSPFDVNGAACVGGDVVLRIEGFDQSVAYRAERLSETLSDIVSAQVERDETAQTKIWTDIRDVAALKDHAFVWRVAMTPSTLLSGLLGGVLQGLAFDTVIDWAGAQTWIGLTQGQVSLVEGGPAGFHALLQNALADPKVTGGAGGHATLIKGPDTFRADVASFQPEPAPLAAIAAGLRAKFDPRGILNPGLMT
jgi:glycolate oxidase FAD binding subunit